MAESDSEISNYEDAVSDDEQSHEIQDILMAGIVTAESISNPSSTTVFNDTKNIDAEVVVEGARDKLEDGGFLEKEHRQMSSGHGLNTAVGQTLIQSPPADGKGDFKSGAVFDGCSNRRQQEFSRKFPTSSVLEDDIEKYDGDEKKSTRQDSPEENIVKELAVDLDLLKLEEESLSDHELERRQCQAQELKEKANNLYGKCDYTAAVQTYTEALRICPTRFAADRAILHSNRAAALLAQERLAPAIDDCSIAVELNPAYAKAYRRRAELYEKSDKLEEALEDFKKLLQLDPTHKQAREACMRLPDQIKERNEKLKDEMLGKLKDLGNMVLKPFGLSTNNFQMIQDPNTGGYSINFKQNANAS